jgi:hypothetical protein
MLGWIVIVACCASATAPPSRSGVIEGVVVNGTAFRSPVAGTAVVLRVENEGSWVQVAETTSDSLGRFRFEELPAADGLVYLPGANHMGIHYPGLREHMKEAASPASQRIVVYDTVAEPSPLVAVRHEIDISADEGVITITETILVANRSLRSYVGGPTSTEQPPVTLQLSIPPEFAKVTFEKEFFGRQFQLNSQRLETHLPWTPGQRELKFTYCLPLETRHWQFHRRLDLPTEQVRLTVASRQKGAVACNLPAASAPTGDGAIFESDGSFLPEGHTIELELGRLSVPWMAYARAIAVAALLLSVLGTSLYMLRRQRAQPAPDKATASAPTARRPRTLPRARRSSSRDLRL